jgi:hypothetical protein
MNLPAPSFTAFCGSQWLATGALPDVAAAAKPAFNCAEADPTAPAVLVFDNSTGQTVEIDWRGSVTDVVSRLAGPESGAAAPDTVEAAASDAAPRGPGRPRLGVVPREVTLLPRHWDWLARQPGGASVALRKLVEAARRSAETEDRVRQASTVAWRFMSTIAGNEPHLEEASRALFAGDRVRFTAHIADWPVDVQAHLNQLAADAFSA